MTNTPRHLSESKKQPHHGQKGQRHGGKLWPDMSPNKKLKGHVFGQVVLCLYVEPLKRTVYTVDTGIQNMFLRSEHNLVTLLRGKVYNSTSLIN